MTDCYRCRRHPEDGDCQPWCRHRTALPGSQLCAVCKVDTRDALDNVQAAWLLTEPDTHTRQGSPVRGRDRGLPGGVERLNWRSAATIAARSWALLAMEDFGWRIGNTDTPELVEWLRACWETRGLVTHEAAGDFADEMGDLAAAGVRIAGLGDVGQRVPCQAPWGESVCGRTLLIDVRTPTLEVHCPRCRSVWTSGRLILVALSEGGHDAWLDAEAIEVCMGVPSRTLRSWGQRNEVRRRSGLYAVDDVRYRMMGMVAS